MSKIRIALDLDGTLADIIGSWLKHYNSKNGNRLEYDNISKWDFWVDLGYKPEQFFRELSLCWREWRSIKPTEPNLAYTIANLARFGKVDIVTARDEESSIYAKLWLKEHGIKYDKFILVARGSDKAYLDYDLFIDDSPVNARKITSNGKKILLYDQPWNRHLDHVPRIKHLRDAVRLIPMII